MYFSLRRAQAYIQMKDYEEAIDDLDSALKISPEDKGNPLMTYFSILCTPHWRGKCTRDYIFSRYLNIDIFQKWKQNVNNSSVLY